MSDTKSGETKPRKMVRRRIAVVFGIICIILAVGLVGVISSLQNQVNDLINTLNLGKSLASFGNQTTLTVWAWSDASYSFGSSKWMFLYEPSFGSSHEVYLSFPFPFFSINPSEAERLQGEPILITVCTTTGQNEMEGRSLDATAGASYTWDGIEITVPIANTYYVVLAFRSLS